MWDLVVSVPDHCLSFYFDPVCINICVTANYMTNLICHRTIPSF